MPARHCDRPDWGSRADLHFASDRGDIVLKNLAIGSQTGMFASVAL
jgi:hypothetical protein